MIETASDLLWQLLVDGPVLVVMILLVGVFLFFGTLNLLLAIRFRPTPASPSLPNPERVAILVPVRDDVSIFNSLPYLRAIEYPDYEVIVIDDSRDPAFRDRLDAIAGGQFRILRRPLTSGRKGAAINFALQDLARRPPRFVVILDADHRPPPDFLARAVTAIEQTRAHCVCGYQKHDVGSHGLFGLFYRAGQAAGIRNLKARYDLGFGAFFGGAAAIFEYDWLRERGFDETSITEDWELSLRSYADGDFRIVIREDLWVSAAVPKHVGWLVRQTFRWTAGTTRDFRKHVRRLLRARLPIATKVGLCYHGLFGLQNPAFLLFWVVLPLLFPDRLPLLPSLAIFGFLGFAWGWPLYRGSKFEGYTLRQAAAALLYGFGVAYVLAPVGAYAFALGLVRDSSFWKVTKRRG